MKIGSKLQFEVPDECPVICPNFEARLSSCRGDECYRCPVSSCRPVYKEPDGSYFYALYPDRYRDDWAAEWEQFFRDGTWPEMKIEEMKK